MSKAQLAENNELEANVGTLTSLDQDEGDTHTYTLVKGDGDTDNALFTIEGNALKAAQVFDYETKSSFNIRIQTKDSGGLTFETTKVITIQDAHEIITSLSEANTERLKVFPNPTNRFLLISSDQKIDYITLINIYGSTVWTELGGSKQIQLNLAPLGSGVYTALISAKGKIYIRRIAVVK